MGHSCLMPSASARDATADPPPLSVLYGYFVAEATFSVTPPKRAWPDTVPGIHVRAASRPTSSGAVLPRLARCLLPSAAPRRRRWSCTAGSGTCATAPGRTRTSPAAPTTRTRRGAWSVPPTLPALTPLLRLNPSGCQVQANNTAPVDSLPPFSQVDLGETPLNESAAEARLRLFDELPACA